MNRDNDNDAALKETFPCILHRMLEVEEAEGNGHIVSWNPDGLSFSIHKPKLFAGRIMGKHFNQTKYKSFQRQLNLYEFRRDKGDKDTKGIYFHRFFVRHDRQLCKFVRRPGRNKHMRSPAVSSRTSPNSIREHAIAGNEQGHLSPAIDKVSYPLPRMDRENEKLSIPTRTTIVMEQPQQEQDQLCSLHIPSPRPFPSVLYIPIQHHQHPISIGPFQTTHIFGQGTNDDEHHNNVSSGFLAMDGGVPASSSWISSVGPTPPTMVTEDDASIVSIEMDGMMTESFPKGSSLEGFSWVLPA